MKILAVGMNYAEHNKELNNSFLPTEPVIFSKPESSLNRDGKPFFVPDFAERFDFCIGDDGFTVVIFHTPENISEELESIFLTFFGCQIVHIC